MLMRILLAVLVTLSAGAAIWRAVTRKTGNATPDKHCRACSGMQMGVVHAGSRGTSNVVADDTLTFTMQNITVNAGDTVLWSNDIANIAPHTVTSDPSSTEIFNGSLSPGQTFQHTFNTPGVFGYYCTIH